MSIQAPFVDAASAIDPTNFSNTFISYYTYGAAVGLALDLAIRERFDNLSLDSLMQQMWMTHGKTEVPYTIDNIREALVSVTGNARFANDFFARYINGNELPDYSSLLENAGFELRLANKGQATAGAVSLEFDGKDAFVAGNTMIGSPLYDAGLDRGDLIVSIDRLKIKSQGKWTNALSRYQPGDTATIRFIQRGIERSSEITFDESPLLEIVLDDASDAQHAFREAWLGPDSD